MSDHESPLDYATAMAMITAWADDESDGVGSWITVTDDLRTVEDWERAAIALADLVLVVTDRAAAAEGVPRQEIIRDLAEMAAWRSQESDEQAS